MEFIPTTSREMAYLDAVLIDFDGTLFDTLGVARDVFREFARRHGFDDGDDEFARLNGPSLPEIVRHLHSTHELKHSPDALQVEYSALLIERYAQARPNPGAEELVRFASSHRVRVVIVSSAPAPLVTECVRRLEWSNAISSIVSGDVVAKAKPDPAIYAAALERIRSEPGSVLAIEDSVNGVRSAAGARVPVIGYAPDAPFAASPKALEDAGARRTIRSLFDATRDLVR